MLWDFNALMQWSSLFIRSADLLIYKLHSIITSPRQSVELWRFIVGKCLNCTKNTNNSKNFASSEYSENSGLDSRPRPEQNEKGDNTLFIYYPGVYFGKKIISVLDLGSSSATLRSKIISKFKTRNNNKNVISRKIHQKEITLVISF